MNKPLMTVVLVVVVLLGVSLLFLGGDSEATSDTTQTREQPIVTTADDTREGGDAMVGDTDAMMEASPDVDTTFVMTGENFKFVMDGVDNPDMIVNVGDKVRVEFSSTSGFHDWVLDEFGAATAKVRETDGSTYVEFVADTIGTFEYYCSVGSHRQNGMKGAFIVQ